jgi:hypothetical protein
VVLYVQLMQCSVSQSSTLGAGLAQGESSVPDVSQVMHGWHLWMTIIITWHRPGKPLCCNVTYHHLISTLLHHTALWSMHGWRD